MDSFAYHGELGDVLLRGRRHEVPQRLGKRSDVEDCGELGSAKRAEHAGISGGVSGLELGGVIGNDLSHFVRLC
jgi:hypothetical protein